MKFGVVVFPGSNCDMDMVYVLATIMKQEVVKLWHKDSHLQNCDFIILPGGFSFGDYLRSGAIAAKSNILNEVIKAANDGCLVLGVCNGFQILIEAGLLKGTLLRNKKLKFINKDVSIKVVNTDNKFCNKYKKNQILKLNIAHNEGNYFASSEYIKELEEKNLIAFKYCDINGNINQECNPNGSLNNIAGIFNEKKNILGMMPHPERMVDQIISNNDGVNLFQSLLG